MAAKKTKKEYFEELKVVVGNADIEEAIKKDYIDFINHEIEILTKKSSATTKKKTDGQAEVMETILAALSTVETPVSILDMLKRFPDLETYKEGETVKEMSPQKLTSMVTKLVKEGKVVRTEDKKKAYFSLA